MSTLIAAEEALLATCRAYLAGAVFTAANSSRDDWGFIDTSGSEWGLVIDMAGETEEGDNLDRRGSHGLYQERHRLGVTVTLKIGTGAEGAASLVSRLKTTMEGLKDHLRANDRLGLPDVVSSARPLRTSVVMERALNARGAPTHLLQRAIVTVYCESSYPESEGGW